MLLRCGARDLDLNALLSLSTRDLLSRRAPVAARAIYPSSGTQCSESNIDTTLNKGYQ